MGAKQSSTWPAGAEDPRVHIKQGYTKGRLPYHGVCYKEGKPSPPEGVPLVTDITHNALTLSWLAPPGVSARSILSYQVEMLSLADRKWRVVCTGCQSTDYDVKNLTPGQEYMFRVKAENIYGKSKPGHVSPVVRTQEWRQYIATDLTTNAKKLTRRHSHHVGPNEGAASLSHTTEEIDSSGHVTTMPFRRHTHSRASLPVSRNSISCARSFTLDNHRSLRSRNRNNHLVTSGSETTDRSQEVVVSCNNTLERLAPRDRFSTASSTGTSTVSSSSSATSSASTVTSSYSSEEDCSQSMSASSLMSIPEEVMETDFRLQDAEPIDESEDLLTSILKFHGDDNWKLSKDWNTNCKQTTPTCDVTNNNKTKYDIRDDNCNPRDSDNVDNDKNIDWNHIDKNTDQSDYFQQNGLSSFFGGADMHSRVIMSSPYSDDTKLAWCSQMSPKSH